MRDKDGGPAFPTMGGEFQGLSIRDYFAAQALNGMCGGDQWPRVDDGPVMAKRAYLFADALLAERAK